jgi:hypothetical protein
MTNYVNLLLNFIYLVNKLYLYRLVFLLYVLYSHYIYVHISNFAKIFNSKYTIFYKIYIM